MDAFIDKLLDYLLGAAGLVILWLWRRIKKLLKDIDYAHVNIRKERRFRRRLQKRFDEFVNSQKKELL